MTTKNKDEQFMKVAIRKAKEGMTKGHFPFGACIVKGGEVISCEHNEVFTRKDATAHAEICAIHSASKKLKGPVLTDCVIYSTCEPCPMCFSACHWARISKIVYGASIEDSKELFNELTISCKELKRAGGSPVKIVGNVMKNECRALFEEWKK